MKTNSEKMIIVKITDGIFINSNLAFKGSIEQAKAYAKERGFAGGVEIYNPKTMSMTKVK